MATFVWDLKSVDLESVDLGFGKGVFFKLDLN